MQPWITLLSAIFGGLTGVAGTRLGSRMQLREAGRIRAEQYSREDRYRLNSERISAYSDFYKAAGHARAVLMHRRDDRRTEIAARDDVWVAYTRVLLVGDSDVLQVANDILKFVTDVVFEGIEFNIEAYAYLIRRLQRTARADLTGAQE